MEWIGIIGSLFLLVKIALHVYIKTIAAAKDYNFGGGYFINLEFFFPITDEVPENAKSLKMVGNVLYAFSILALVIFLIGVNTGRVEKND